MILTATHIFCTVAGARYMRHTTQLRPKTPRSALVPGSQDQHNVGLFFALVPPVRPHQIGRSVPGWPAAKTKRAIFPPSGTGANRLSTHPLLATRLPPTPKGLRRAASPRYGRLIPGRERRHEEWASWLTPSTSLPSKGRMCGCRVYGPAVPCDLRFAMENILWQR